jgi:ABC-type uncharacterized transport system permease subunit
MASDRGATFIVWLFTFAAMVLLWAGIRMRRQILRGRSSGRLTRPDKIWIAAAAAALVAALGFLS